MQYANLRVTTFCIGSPKRVFWAQECVVGAQVEVFTRQHTLILLFYGRQNLKQNFSLLKITPIKPLFLLYTASNTKLGIDCEISNLKNIVL